MAAESAFREREGGWDLRVRVTPRGGRDRIDGVEILSDGRQVLKVRVRAAPEEGAANDAARRVVAEALGRPVSAVTLVSGATARVKSLRIEGEPVALRAALASVLGPPAGSAD
jgi:uncharacterized protein YggU (UPF0235/DUF167 family)